MIAKDIMSTKPVLIERKASLLEAAKMMQEHQIGILPVVDREHVVGMVTDRDLVVRAMARGVNPKETCVDLIMTQEVITCRESATLEQVVEMMETHRMRRLLVLNQEKVPVGIISVEDLASRALDKHLAASALYRGTREHALQNIDVSL